MKKIKLFLILAMLTTCLSSQAFALFRVEGEYTGYNGQTGIGVGINFPLIPFMDTTIYYTPLAQQEIELPGFTYGGETFATGDIKVNASVIELQLMFPIPLTEFAVGMNTFYDMIYAKPSGSDAVMLPGSLYAGIVGQYRHNFVPLVAAFAQVGYSFKVIDGEKLINDKVDVTLDLGDIDKSGLMYRVGISIGL